MSIGPQPGRGEPPAEPRRRSGASANNTGLPNRLKAGVENLSGLPMDDVKVHFNSSKPSTLHALAYTQGTDIHVGPGQERHLPHEAWHVAQQKQGRVKPTLQMKGIAINDDDALEREADAMGARASQRERQSLHLSHGARRGAGALDGAKPHAEAIQRKIIMANGTTYEDAKDVKIIMAEIANEKGKWDNKFGGTLASMINSATPHGPFKNYLELLARLETERNFGKAAQAIGKEREEKAAKSSDAKIADTGKYGGDKVVHLKGTHRHVKLDIENEQIYGIVGGAAKAKNLEKFKGICGDLKAISEQDHRTPQVFCDRSTPYEVAEAAAKIVGKSNVIDLESGHPLFETGAAYDADFKDMS